MNRIISEELYETIYDILDAGSWQDEAERLKNSPLATALDHIQKMEAPQLVSVDDLLVQEVYSLREKLKIAIDAIQTLDPKFDTQLFAHQLNSVDFDQLMEELSGTHPQPVPKDIDAWKEVDRLCSALNYIRGIVERGIGHPLENDVSIENAVLNYVKELEAKKPQPVHGVPTVEELREAGYRLFRAIKANGELSVDQDIDDFANSLHTRLNRQEGR